MHDHVYAPVKKTPLALEATDPVRTEVVTPTAFVSIDKKSNYLIETDVRLLNNIYRDRGVDRTIVLGKYLF